MLLQANTPKRLYFGLKVIRQFSSVSPAPVIRCVQAAAVRDVLVPRPSVRLLSVSAVRWRPEELGSAPAEAPPPLSSAAEEKLFSPAAAADAPPPVSPAAEATPPPPEQVNITAAAEAEPSMSDPAPTFTAEVEAPPAAPAQEELIFEVPPPPEAEPLPSELEFTIPDKPSAPLDLGQVGEPTLESMGLASWWPSGRLQYFLESVSPDPSLISAVVLYSDARQPWTGVVPGHRGGDALHADADDPGGGDGAEERGQHEQQHSAAGRAPGGQLAPSPEVSTIPFFYHRKK